MDQHSGSTIIGERKTELRTYTREDTTLSRTDGSLTHNTKSLNAHMDGHLSTATWHERDRYQNMLVMRYKDGKNPGQNVHSR